MSGRAARPLGSHEAALQSTQTPAPQSTQTPERLGTDEVASQSTQTAEQIAAEQKAAEQKAAEQKAAAEHLRGIIVERISAREFKITGATKSLIEICCSAWILEPIPLKVGGIGDRPFLEATLQVIAEKALADPHVSVYKGTDKEVPFIHMFYSLAKAGKVVMGDLIDKGFLDLSLLTGKGDKGNQDMQTNEVKNTIAKGTTIE